ncbi:hypothetical protein BCT86_00825 [Vibrio breoganii]|uniref:hypothetical protein n=1 Tax=Vibrio breoganii TaxID=553239 RepID=UPI000C827FEC|nr:hypothetical protein [Vibrio breoganii]PML10544.1 hypothetical protein BCT86_00825 [Vibrio breoganii]
MSSETAWRDLNVYRDSKYDNLVTRFCSTRTKTTESENQQSVIFKTVKELMVFAALIGLETENYKPISGGKKIPITLDTYSRTKHDAYIYLIALSQQPDLDVLKNENLPTAIKHFEAYCNGGLEVISNWILQNLSEDFGTNTIFSKVLEHLTINNE